MRLAVVTRYAWPHPGGVEAVVRALANGMADRGWEVTVLAQSIGPELSGYGYDPFPPSVDDYSGVPTECLDESRGGRSIADLADGLAYRLPDFLSPALLRAESSARGRSYARHVRSADVVHRFGGNPRAVAIACETRRQKVPLVITPFAHPGRWDDDERSARAYRMADAVVATCPEDADIYRGLGVEDRRLYCCDLPTPEFRPADRGRAIRSVHDVRGGLVLYLGARRSYKGVPELLAAAGRLAVTHPAARVAFVGPGPSLPLDSPPNVIDVGMVGAEERDGWIDASDVVCVPSSAESYSLAVSEAWSAGKPVVTSDIPVLAGRVSRSGAGIAVPAQPERLAEAIDALLSNPETRLRMGRAGRLEWERHLDPGRFLDFHEDLYTRIGRTPGRLRRPAGNRR